ncbi:hypothetical protein MuYL_4028 [Mucilaginibacter xinganensis]|uniref:Uncharacterized protein n=1 Tax=Mucilaginibacter xinganensis TaxID=1234841 RepID=A0A223P197_9SPHI|nr:hypothetical protein MuYL_4028 [Mucilaginibacter xinganensis]
MLQHKWLCFSMWSFFKFPDYKNIFKNGMKRKISIKGTVFSITVLL